MLKSIEIILNLGPINLNIVQLIKIYIIDQNVIGSNPYFCERKKKSAVDDSKLFLSHIIKLESIIRGARGEDIYIFSFFHSSSHDDLTWDPKI